MITREVPSLLLNNVRAEGDLMGDRPVRDAVAAATLRSMFASASSESMHCREIRWVFLDRDGTLNVKAAEGEYIERPEDLELLPGAAEAVRTFNQAGIWTGVVTNQRGVALGRMTPADLEAVHARLGELLASQGAFLDAIYSCPHQVGVCDCRKPGPGMLLEAQRENPGLDFARAAIVGDSPSDVETGRRLGLRTVMLAPNPVEQAALDADHVVSDLVAAVQVLSSECDRPNSA